jgi:hypothetical protein
VWPIDFRGGPEDDGVQLYELEGEAVEGVVVGDSLLLVFLVGAGVDFSH